MKKVLCGERNQSLADFPDSSQRLLASHVEELFGKGIFQSLIDSPQLTYVGQKLAIPT